VDLSLPEVRSKRCVPAATFPIMPDIRLSIITACRNAELFLPGCVDNVARQVTPEIEHIIVDGASTDSTVKLIERHAENHPHIRWISEPDTGQSQAMNKGIAMARGEIIGFLNVDDIYNPGVLQRALDIFSGLEAPAFIAANCDLVGRGGRVVRRSRPEGLSLETLLSGEVLPPLNPTSYFYHKSLHDICGPYDEDEHNFMDIRMLPRLIRHAHVHYFDEPWGVFRLHPFCKTNQNYLKGNILGKIDEILAEYLKTLPEDIQRPIMERRRQAGPSLRL
jgi:glycosyltransferase involved in cell wall biosynthesis